MWEETWTYLLISALMKILKKREYQIFSVEVVNMGYRVGVTISGLLTVFGIWGSCFLRGGSLRGDVK